ncbi:MAG: M48 family metallopeptidase [Hungatella hathewayi]|nr:M48 family metallopeptidase [Hungatella hathewayi]
MTDEIPFSIVHSRRKTMAIQVTRDGRVVVRCPMRVSDGAARAFVKSHEEWIEKHYREARERLERQVSYPPQQVKEYRRQAAKTLAERTAYWAERMGVTYGRITIREQVTRWGSCSAKGNLNYNWKLILVPKELLDYVVVHELAHRREMNHSNRFWEIVEKELPDYRQRRKALKGYEDKINS